MFHAVTLTSIDKHSHWGLKSSTSNAEQWAIGLIRGLIQLQRLSNFSLEDGLMLANVSDEAHTMLGFVLDLANKGGFSRCPLKTASCCCLD
jgi:hypothetical protein